jgi:hypothetical protein
MQETSPTFKQLILLLFGMNIQNIKGYLPKPLNILLLRSTAANP